MKNATYDRIRRLLPLLVLAGLASPASTVSAGVGVWTSNGPYSGDISALAIDPSHPVDALRRAYGGGSGVFKSTDGGRHLERRRPGRRTYVHSLAIDPSAPTRSMPALNSGGSSRAPMAGGAGALSVWPTHFAVPVLAIDPSTPATVYAGHGGRRLQEHQWRRELDDRQRGLDRPKTFGPWRSTRRHRPRSTPARPSGGVFKSTNGGGSWAPSTPA